ncbi:MAG: hypothetical protein GDA54_01670 [Alphaproteobacteria bacterium GM7ARS4]|nr:hypothetical protein [Alphaproteobacteria bacterium GM7ARS4]
MTDSRDLCARAFAKIGETGFSSLGDDSEAGRIASVLYRGVCDGFLSAHYWNFALRRQMLPRLLRGGRSGHLYSFALPRDFLRAVSAGRDDTGRGLVYHIAGTLLEADSERVVLTYIARVAESFFPPFFQEAFVGHLAAEFCIPLTENTSRARALRERATMLLREAKLIDAQQDTPHAFEDFSLIEERMS